MDAKGGVGNGPDEHKKEFAGSPQSDGTVERLGPIGNLLSGLEFDAKPSPAQWKQRCEEPQVGSRAEQPRTNARSRRQPRRSAATAPADSVKQFASKGKNAVAEGAQSGGKAISTVAGKVKGPALAAGAALAGVAGGMAVQSKRDSGRKVLGMRLGNGVGKTGKNLADAGQSVGRFTENLGEFAAEMRKTREAIDNRAKHRSPIEVVLQALTARR